MLLRLVWFFSSSRDVAADIWRRERDWMLMDAFDPSGICEAEPEHGGTHSGSTM